MMQNWGAIKFKSWCGDDGASHDETFRENGESLELFSTKKLSEAFPAFLIDDILEENSSNES